MTVFENTSLEKLSIEEIESHFSRKGKQKYFFLFDETDAILPQGSTFASSLKIYYDFWNKINHLMYNGHLVYCASQSSIL
jgi:hypothetical protein